MNIPGLSRLKIADKDGNIHPDFSAFLTQLIVEMQRCLSNEGYKLPQQPTTNVTLLNTPQSEGNILYDSVLKKGFLNENGTFKQIVTM